MICRRDAQRRLRLRLPVLLMVVLVSGYGFDPKKGFPSKPQKDVGMSTDAMTAPWY